MVEIQPEVKKHLKFKPSTFLFFLVGILVLFFVFRFAGSKELINAFQRLDPRYILPIISTELLILLIWNYKFKVFMDEISPVKYTKLFAVYLAGILGNNITPGPKVGGEPLKAHFLSKMCKRPFSTCLAIVVMDGVAYLLVFIGYVLFSIAFVFLFLDVPIIHMLLAVGVIGLLVLPSIVYFWGRHERKVKKFGKFLKKAYEFPLFGFLKKRFGSYGKFKRVVNSGIKSFVQSLNGLWANKKRLIIVILLGMIIQFLWYLKDYLIFLSLGQPVPFIWVIAITTVAGFIGYYVFLPGGTGAVEASMIAMYTALGIDLGVAAAATLISRAIFYTVTYGLGYAGLSWLMVKYK